MDIARSIGIYRLKYYDGGLISDTAMEYKGRPFDWKFNLDEEGRWASPYRYDEILDDPNFIEIHVDYRELPIGISRPFTDSDLEELRFKDCYNDLIESFSFEDPQTIARYRHNYRDIAFVLGQRTKYIFLNARTARDNLGLTAFISKLEDLDPCGIYPSVPWDVSEDGRMVYLHNKEKNP